MEPPEVFKGKVLRSIIIIIIINLYKYIWFRRRLYTGYLEISFYVIIYKAITRNTFCSFFVAVVSVIIMGIVGPLYTLSKLATFPLSVSVFPHDFSLSRLAEAANSICISLNLLINMLSPVRINSLVLTMLTLIYGFSYCLFSSIYIALF
jgi:hypothetical protein